jgi:hypothetical protein
MVISEYLLDIWILQSRNGRQRNSDKPRGYTALVRERPIFFSRSKICIYNKNKIKKINKVKPNECHVDAVHKVPAAAVSAAV